MIRRWHVETADCRVWLPTLEDNSVDCCVTSPPYWKLRDYGHDDQTGLEPTPTEFVRVLVAILEQVRRVLKPTGSLWLNLGDSYAGQGGGGQGPTGIRSDRKNTFRTHTKNGDGLKNKDLVGIPWMTAFALREAGWWLRSDIIWAKPNPTPSPVNDRPNRSHEFIFLLSKSERYFYDDKAVREKSVMPPGVYERRHERRLAEGDKGFLNTHQGRSFGYTSDGTRNIRTVWEAPTVPTNGKHPAPMPPSIARRCIQAGCPEDGLVLDPFTGTASVGIAALHLNRRFLGCELVAEHAEDARQRLAGDAPLLDLAAE